MKTNKHFLLTLLLLAVSFGLNAAPISREQAKVNAQSFLQKVKGSRTLAPVQSRAKLGPRRAKSTTAETELYYVFNRGEQQGYVIVSGDDRTPAVLGYTDSGEFDYEQLPVNMRSWLERREMQLEALSSLPESEAPRKASKHDAVAPMVTTHWNQGAPYNDECPMYFTLGRSITGCVATAMAQVLYFQRDKSVREVQADMPGYSTWTAHETYGNLQVAGIEEGSPIDWDNMLDSYGSNATAKQKLAVAQLMHYCGVAVHMDYTNTSSGAQSSEVSGAFQKYFGYGSATRYVRASDYTNDQWDNLLYNELAEGRPLYLSGANSSAGHAFVCDGYDGNGCFHINWGWGGQSDGYFLLTSLNPSSQGLGGSGDGYSDYEEAVIGCEPDNYMELEMPITNATVKRLCIENWDSNGDGKFSYGEAASVTNLGEVFKGQLITTFTELYYFTGLESIADNAFADCTKLNTVKLPKGLKSIGKRSFANCKLLKTFKLNDNLIAIGDSAFAGCRVLPNLALPYGLKRIEANTFEGCVAMTEMHLPLGIQFIGTKAFSGCTKMLTVSVKSVNPERIELGETVFEGIDLSKATLETLQGTRSYFASADQWKEFGNLHENRTLAAGNFATLATNTQFYIYNVGTGYYLTHGEAYDTQAIVANTNEPMRFELRRSTSMAEGVYYLYSNDTGNSRHILFRTSTDGRVGSGVKACFVDGSLSNTAYWKVELVEGEDRVYTLQIPSGQTGYNANEYLGIQPTHASNAATPTYGAYSDIVYADYAQNCHWMLVPYDEASHSLYQHSEELRNLLALANAKRLDTTQEQLVYENFESTEEEIDASCRKLRKKLNFINFKERPIREVALKHYDVDGNNEISYTEAAAVSEINQEFSWNTAITDMSDLEYFTGIDYISNRAFLNCTALRYVKVPDNATGIFYWAFRGDKKLERIDMGSHINNIGVAAFRGCTSLNEVRIAVHDPSRIALGDSVFYGLNLSKATLYVPQGSRELYAKANVWKQFGTIKEMRSIPAPSFVANPEPNVNYYVYNVGLDGYISKGEAWGTQAVVASNGFVYQLRRSATMPDGVYYLYSEQTGKDGKILFRTDSDEKVGKGNKACFVDGQSVTAKAYWQLQPAEGTTNLFTLQVPASDESYTEGEYLGTDYSHATDAAWGTYGMYWDINYEAHPTSCQWGFVSVDEQKQARAFFDLTEQLRKLLERADAVPLECSEEHAIYDDFDSSEEQISDAIASLRGKLHYIDFLDNRARTLCTQKWDTNEDDELSLEEAAAVTDISTVFRTSTTLKSFEELRHFTSITEIPAEAFRGCSALTSIYIPENVTTIGEKAFYTASALKYMAVLSPTLVDASSASLPTKLTAFVPASQMEAYTADAAWSKCTIKEYTGTPVVTAEDASRIYGRTISNYAFDVTGAPINGEPALSCEADATAPVGTYPILCEAGGVTSLGAQFINGTLTVEGAPLTLAAKSYTRNIGEENPEFQFTNSTLKNREKIADILITQPVLECDATIDSPAGVYEIRISGAEAANYIISYTNGTLTVIDPTGINGVDANNNDNAIYDLAGRKVNGKPTRGLYIVGKKKVRL